MMRSSESKTQKYPLTIMKYKEKHQEFIFKKLKTSDYFCMIKTTADQNCHGLIE